MGYLDFKALAAAAVRTDPFDHFIVPNAVSTVHAPAIAADYPAIAQPGSFATKDLRIGPAVQALIDELEGEAFRALVGEKFGLDLSDRATMVTLRGRCAAKDGQIHTDSKSKVVSLLLYLNDLDWPSEGGRLRLLRNGDDIEASAAEIPPTFGHLVVFRRSDNSWHGHKSFAGPRRVLQVNYVRSARVTAVSDLRHGLSALAKRLRARSRDTATVG
jgi:hypothetical protein